MNGEAGAAWKAAGDAARAAQDSARSIQYAKSRECFGTEFALLSSDATMASARSRLYLGDLDGAIGEASEAVRLAGVEGFVRGRPCLSPGRYLPAERKSRMQQGLWKAGKKSGPKPVRASVRKCRS